MRTKEKSKFTLIPASLPLLIPGMILVVVVVAFMGLLGMVGVLPGMYTAIICAVLVILTLLAFKLLACRKRKTKQRKVGVILSIVLIVLLGIGCWYLFNTYSAFNKMSDDDKQYEDFYVVALKDGSYDDLEDIRNQTVHTHKSESTTYETAKDQLKEEAYVTYEEESGYMDLKTVLIDDEGETHDELIFLSASLYEMIGESVEGFEDDTKIIYTVSVEIEKKDIAKRVDVTEDPFNVYISGIDTYGGISKVSRSDVNMIMTVDPVNRKILLTSIPRDMYVTLHSYGALDKLTHSGIYGIDETIATVEDWLDIDINYYMRVNFTSLQDIVNAIGGIDVESPQAFSAGGYSFVAGTNHLNGEQALAFARERYSFAGGDNERVKNQQRVLSGIIHKITSSTAILTGYSNLMNTVGNEVQTNMSNSDISALVRMQLKDLGGWDIQMISIEGTGSSASTYSMGATKLYVMIPDEESVKAAQDAINGMMGE